MIIVSSYNIYYKKLPQHPYKKALIALRVRAFMILYHSDSPLASKMI